MELPINIAPRYAFQNRQDVQRSEKVGCWHCIQIYNANEVKDYTDNGETAICPKCGIDAVLPTADLELTEEILQKINKLFLD